MRLQAVVALGVVFMLIGLIVLTRAIIAPILHCRKAVPVEWAEDYYLGFYKMVGLLAEEAAEEMQRAMHSQEAKQT